MDADAVVIVVSRSGGVGGGLGGLAGEVQEDLIEGRAAEPDVVVGDGLLVGWRPEGGAAKIAVGFALMLIAGYAFSWIFIFIGLVAGNAQAAQGLSMLVIPFSFISSANVPVSSMPGWMQPFAANQPISVIINAVRGYMLGGVDQLDVGHTLGYWTVLSLLWCAGILLVFGFLSVRRFSKMK